MSDKFAGGIKAGSTDVSIAVILRSTTDNTETTGVAHTSVNASYWRQGSTRTDIDPTSTLAAVDSAHSDKGWKEVDSTNMPGVYRFDLPDAVVDTGADWVVVSIVVSGSYAFVERYHLETSGAAENNAVLTNANYGLDKLVRSTTPADTLNVASGRVDVGLIEGSDATTVLGTAQTGDVYAELPTGFSALSISSGRVDVASIEGSDATDQITSACNAAIDTAISTPTASSLGAYAEALNTRLTAARAGYLDNLNGHTPQTGDTYAELPSSFSSLVIDGNGRVDVSKIEGSDATDTLGTAQSGDVYANLPSFFSDLSITETTGQVTVNDLSATAASTVKTQVETVMSTDTLSELSGDPGATPTFEEAIMTLYHKHRCKVTQDGSNLKVYNNAGSEIFSQSTTESGGTVTVNKIGT